MSVTLPNGHRLPNLEVHDTTLKVLQENADHHGADAALREKEYGIWQTFDWITVFRRVRCMALGLHHLGLGKGDVVALLGDNRPAWIMGELAAHAIQGMSLGIYRDALEDEIRYLLTYADVKAIFCEDEEQVDKILNLEDEIPTLQHIIFDDPRGMRRYDDPRLISLADLVAHGEATQQNKPALFDEMVSAGKGEDVCVLCTTSGTTSRPKLAEITHRMLLQHCERYLEADPMGPDDEVVANLPLSWIMGQIYMVGWWLLARLKVNFAEEEATLMADMREISPTFALFAPRVWEQLAADIRAKVMDADSFKRRLFDWGVKKGIAAVENGKKSKLVDLAVGWHLRDRMGFTRLRSAATGGAALGPDTFKFFLAIGVPLRQLYGQTELMGAYTLHPADQVDYETVGLPFRGVELRIDNPDHEGLGEIITRHPFMMQAYYRNPEATAETYDDQGWMHTGDAGYLDKKNHLIVIDRVKDLATTSQGTRFSPQYIENKLKFSPFVGETVVLGRNRPYLTTMICIRWSIISKWAEKQRINYTTYTDLSSKPQVYDLIRREVETVNKSLPPAQQIRKFLLLYKELDADDGELTRTRKVRRTVIDEKYAGIIDSLYTGQDMVDIDTTIQFQDGSSQRIKTSLRIVDLRPGEPDGDSLHPQAPAAEALA